MYKLVCTDMDGTLLDSKGNISENNIKSIKAASAKGVKITVCTGRLFTSALYFSDLIGVKVPIIASNGAYIREKDRNEVIYKSVLGKENCKKILEVVRKYGINPHFNTTDIVFSEKISYSSSSYAKFNEGKPKDKQIKIQLVENWDKVFDEYDDEILKCICAHEDINKVLNAKEDMHRYSNLEVVSSWSNNFEVMCKGVSKGRAVEILANLYDIKREEIICIGDNENDLSMIKYAGLGVAMGNAEEAVKKQANFISRTNDNDGVSYVIDKFILD